jgi:hypothetical protein
LAGTITVAGCRCLTLSHSAQCGGAAQSPAGNVRLWNEVTLRKTDFQPGYD